MNVYLSEIEFADRYLNGARRTAQRWRVTGEGPPFVRFGPRQSRTDCGTLRNGRKPGPIAAAAKSSHRKRTFEPSAVPAWASGAFVYSPRSLDVTTAKRELRGSRGGEANHRLHHVLIPIRSR